MHMSDALISPSVAGSMYVLTAAVTAYSVKKVKEEDNSKKIALMGIMGAFIFASQMVNFSIPGTGSSGHLAGGMLLAAILGPSAGFLTMIAVLAVQAFFFADGGILALGANIWNMAFYGCFVGAFLVWKTFMKKGLSNKKIIAASMIGSVLALSLGAFSVTLETMASNITELPFAVFNSAMLPIHLAIGVVEGAITAAVLCFIYKSRPELLWSDKTENTTQTANTQKLSFKATLLVFLVTLVFIGGGLSLLASSKPDGLEWSISKTAGSKEIVSKAKTHQIAENIQNKTALLPDYSFKGSESSLGTSISGILGSFFVILFCVVFAYSFRFFRRKKVKNE